MNFYEHTFIGRQDLSESQNKELIDKYQNFVNKNSGKIQFHNDKSHNEIAPGIFTSLTLSKIVTPNIYNVSTVRLDTDVDDIIIFPSKTMHSVLPSVSAGSKDRISISADVSMIIKNSTNSETLLTPVDKWMKF